MDVTIIPNKLQGTVTPPSSKSVGHRALIAAALSGGVSRISRLTPSQDMEATLSCLTVLGTGVEWTEPDQVAVHGLGNSIPQRGPFPPAGLRGVRVHPALSYPSGPGGERGRAPGIYRPGPPDGAAPGTLLLPLSGEGDLLSARKRRAHRPGSTEGGHLFPPRRCVQPVYHRPAVRPPPAGREQRDRAHHPLGVKGICGPDPGCAEQVRYSDRETGERLPCAGQSELPGP